MASVVFPFHDPRNIELKFLKRSLPFLQSNFKNAFVSVTPQTLTSNIKAISFLQSTEFFKINMNAESSSIGEHFIAGFKNAVEKSAPDEILHLCSSDRLSFAVLNHAEAFINDVRDIRNPTLFMRSTKAWMTHPQIYWAAESLVTEAGQKLFGKTIDFDWCHLTLSAGMLKEILPQLKSKDLVVTAEIVFLLKDLIQKRYVDWLSWEDPFILGKNAISYREQRNSDTKELDKRMSYVKPQIDYLFEQFLKNRS